EFFKAAAAELKARGFNLKVTFKTVIKSAYYRGVSGPEDVAPGVLTDIGTARLLSPEMLNRKIVATTGVHWRKNYEYEKSHDWLLEDDKILYGGIDSENVPTRLTSPNGVIASVAFRMANEVACSVTGFDFTKPAEQRTLFSGVELDKVPESAGNPV